MNIFLVHKHSCLWFDVHMSYDNTNYLIDVWIALEHSSRHTLRVWLLLVIWNLTVLHHLHRMLPYLSYQHCWRHFLFPACTKWEMNFSNPRIHRSTTRTGRQAFAVWHPTRTHVRSNNLYTTYLTRSGPSKGHRVHKYYEYPVHIRSTRTIVIQRVRYLGTR